MAWENDKLDRQWFAQHVKTLLLERYRSRDNFIANLDAPWGQGKTFFLKNLAEQLSSDGFTVAYVNAWQDDRTNTPLIAVLSAIDDAVRANQKLDASAVEKLDVARKKLAPVIGEIGKQAGKHAVKILTGMSIDGLLEIYGSDDEYEPDGDAISKGIDAVLAKRVSNIVADRLKSQQTERAAISSFRDKTAEALSSSGMTLPLFVIVDELDRCRPTYAVQMLEEMKHLFAISGVVFLIGTDTLQLSHSVNALYGEKFESQRYLRRFFDRVIVFPPTSRSDFLNSLVGNSSINWNLFTSHHSINTEHIFLSLFDGLEYSNRDIEQFIEILDTFTSSWAEKCKIEPVCLAALIDDYLGDPTQFPHEADLMRVEQRRQMWVINDPRKPTKYISKISQAIFKCANQDLHDYRQDWEGSDYFVEEHNLRIANRTTTGIVRSFITSYRSRIILSARTSGE